MKFSNSILAILAAVIVIISCKKEMSSENGDLPNEIEEGWEFTEAGILNTGPVDTAFVQTVGSISTLSIIGSTGADQQGEIFLQIVGEEITTGTFTNPLVFFQYSENGSVVYQSNPVDAGEFTIVITQLDSSTVTGTFTGNVKDSQGNNHTITEGKFKTKVSFSNDDPDTIETGVLTVWSREICADGGSLEIRVSGQSEQITDGFTSEPICSEAGSASFTLLTGNYTVEAICGTDTVRYDVVIDNECTLLEVDMQNPPEVNDYLPMVQGSAWIYTDLADATSSHTITVDGSENFEGRLFSMFVSDNNDTFYFRKDQGVYFEYRTLNFQDFVTNAPSLELVMLHENYEVGQIWESTVEDITLSNIPVKVKLRSNILRRDYTANINGVNYPDCIEVNTEIMFSSDNGTTFQPGNSYNRVFSKDKGIVYYYDINREVEWGVTSISLNP